MAWLASILILPDVFNYYTSILILYDNGNGNYSIQWRDKPKKKIILALILKKRRNDKLQSNTNTLFCLLTSTGSIIIIDDWLLSQWPFCNYLTIVWQYNNLLLPTPMCGNDIILTLHCNDNDNDITTLAW